MVAVKNKKGWGVPISMRYMCYGKEQINNPRDFPCGPVLGLGTFTAMAQSSIPGQGTKNPQSREVWPKVK